MPTQDTGRYRREGPAGLLLGQLLHINGIDSVIVENRSREIVIDRVRAGVLEQGTVDLLHAAGVGSRLQQEGLRHEGLYISFQGVRHHIDFAELTGGKAITVYGQNEVVRDLIDARWQRPPAVLRGRERLVGGMDSSTPTVRFRHEDAITRSVAISSPAATFHGICRPSIPDGVLTIYERVYPFGWLGSWLKRRPRPTSSSTRTMSAASRFSACARRKSRGSTFRCRRTSRSELVRRGDLGRDARTNDHTRWLAAKRRPHHAEERDADAQLRGHTNAPWPPLPGRRRRAHRPADRREGLEPGSLRCARLARAMKEFYEAGARNGWTHTPMCAPAASGRRSGSRGG